MDSGKCQEISCHLVFKTDFSAGGHHIVLRRLALLAVVGPMRLWKLCPTLSHVLFLHPPARSTLFPIQKSEYRSKFFYLVLIRNYVEKFFQKCLFCRYGEENLTIDYYSRLSEVCRKAIPGLEHHKEKFLPIYFPEIVFTTFSRFFLKRFGNHLLYNYAKREWTSFPSFFFYSIFSQYAK